MLHTYTKAMIRFSNCGGLSRIVADFPECKYGTTIGDATVDHINGFKCYHIVCGQGLHRPGKVLEFDLGPGKLLKFENWAICPGIVLHCRIKAHFTLCMLSNLLCFCCLLTFLKNNFQKIISGTLSACQTFLIHIRTDVLSVLIWVQTVCKDYQLTTKIAAIKEGVKWINCLLQPRN